MELDISGAKILFTLPIDLPILGPLRISETMVVSWIVMILITGLCIWLTHDLKEENISKRQAMAEMLVEMANKFVVGNMGEQFRYMIPFVAASGMLMVVGNIFGGTSVDTLNASTPLPSFIFILSILYFFTLAVAWFTGPILLSDAII